MTVQESPMNEPVACRMCRKPVRPDVASFPFCSPRCQTQDLAKWADGSYTISRPIEEADLDQGE